MQFTVPHKYRNCYIIIAGEYTRAITTYIKAINMHIEKGVNLTNEAKYIEAIEHYDRALYIFYKIANSYSYRGKQQFKLNNYTQAIKDYSKAIYLDSVLMKAHIDRPQLMEAYLEREQVISKLKNTYIENQDWETNEYNLYLSNIYLGRGIALYKWGDKDDAYWDFIESINFGNEEAIEWLENFRYDEKNPSSKPFFR